MQVSHLTVHELTTEKDAVRITDFYLSPHAFDDQRHTPGELDHFRHAPKLSLSQRNHRHWFLENEEGEIIAVTSCKENEHQSGGFLWDYLAVHREYRRHGFAKVLFHALETFARNAQGRYILTYTCDLPEYLPIQKMFKANGFELIGSYPNYYYEGEARLAFYKPLSP